jgi:hypothetical protein
MTDNTQLTTASGYDTKRMMFSEPQNGSIPNSPINFKRIMISTLNPDGTSGELILPTERVFSFGVSENKSPDTGKVNGYVLPLCLWNRDGATKEEKAWSDTFNNIVDQCKQYLLANREELEQYELEMVDLKKLNCLYYRKEKGKVVEGTGPTLYAKLMVSKKLNKIVSMFFGKDGNTVDPLTLMGKYCYIRGAVKIESIFIGNKISLQVKLYEAEVELMQSGLKRLLSRPTPNPRVLTSTDANPLTADDLPMEELALGNDEDDGEGSLDETEPTPEPVKKKKVVRRVKKVVKK